MNPSTVYKLKIALAVVLLASTYSIFGLAGAWIAFIVFFFTFRFWKALIFAIVFSAVSPLLSSPRNDLEAVFRNVFCGSQQRELSGAILKYEKEKNRFPAAYQTDADGKPIHSWRTEVLPFADWTVINQKYHFDRPWNDPINKEISDIGIYSIHCPNTRTVYTSGSSYVAVTGPNTIWPGKETVTRAEFTDDPASTILFVEIADEIPNWAEPRDISLDELSDPQNLAKTIDQFSIHFRFTPGLLYRPLKYANVAFADGSVKLLSADFLTKNIHALATHNGGEKINLDDDPGLKWRTDPWWLEYLVQFIAAASGIGLIVVTFAD